ncbi:YaiI/YqxD family protein [Methyloligella sp. 2.7D]|uniref:YaiI/YqxD family protein n=1 Tax=unclassified Methyloligella TaxID=2625955 RepID=UPI00157CF143|nr:YaiI/YqxD family protein [Methyloligella sp. GL2]QKP77220.1 YaiI/YqxD family protein [Methyloligella sp. GL2]
MPDPILILVDADACPVKDEVFRVALRYGIKTIVVSNAFMMLPKHPDIERVIVEAGLDVADDWIAERARPGVIVITNDVPLAHRAVTAGAEALAPNGKPFDSASIGMALAMRDLMTDLRSAGETTGGPRPFSKADRSAFLQSLDQAIVRLKRAGHPAAQPEA